MPSPFLTSEPAGIWLMWNLSRRKSWCSFNQTKCPDQKVTKRLHSLDQRLCPFVCEVDGHKGGLHVLSVQRGDHAMVADDSGWAKREGPCSQANSSTRMVHGGS